MVNVVSDYASMVGCELEKKKKILRDMNGVIQWICSRERVVIGVDVNGHLGERNRGDIKVMCKFSVFRKEMHKNRPWETLIKV